MTSLDVEVFGPSRLPLEEIERLVELAVASAGLDSGHVAVQFVSPERIAELNAEHRGVKGPTDVLSFPIDGIDPPPPPPAPQDGIEPEPPAPLELGDIVICPEHTADLREAIVHGALHLTGMDHETDDGEMLAVQREILAWVRP